MSNVSEFQRLARSYLWGVQVERVEGGFLGQDLVGTDHNLLFRSDFRDSNMLGALVYEKILNGGVAEQVRSTAGYAIDRALLSESKGRNTVDKFLRPPPSELFGFPFQTEDRGVR